MGILGQSEQYVTQQLIALTARLAGLERNVYDHAKAAHDRMEGLEKKIIEVSSPHAEVGLASLEPVIAEITSSIDTFTFRLMKIERTVDQVAESHSLRETCMVSDLRRKEDRLAELDKKISDLSSLQAEAMLLMLADKRDVKDLRSRLEGASDRLAELEKRTDDLSNLQAKRMAIAKSVVMRYRGKAHNSSTLGLCADANPLALSKRDQSPLKQAARHDTLGSSFRDSLSSSDIGDDDSTTTASPR
eukprot:gnl/TRDRNA2_/TRDRNA2_91338_c0_seq1.p1 gnl/TRDRNA2_/TRDRNA2_91338_c0~~gnl/TRDRNA2_/TRDRNA2_91338_c0_seq1.p1  ORF type:complete len:246 (-),score=32.25 gnl/TRDRNA2_/TRDRNA2_91338_c0_seq1:129-866(-)